MLRQVVSWRDRCQAAVQDVRTYIEEGPTATETPAKTAAATRTSTTQSPQIPHTSTGAPADGSRDGNPSSLAAQLRQQHWSEEGRGSQGGGGSSSTGGIGAKAGVDIPHSFAGVVLPSIGRDLGVEAGLLERLGRLVCEGALIEVVDVHKEVRAKDRALLT